MTARVNAEGFFIEQPAIGTRVTLPEGIEGVVWYRSNAGKSGVVYDHRYDRATVRVRFDDGEQDFGFWTALTPEVTSPAPEITLNGHRYVLAETPAPEVKREPKQGEIWRDVETGCPLMRTKQGGWVQLRNIDGNAGGIWRHEPNVTFLASDLAAAIEAGEKFL